MPNGGPPVVAFVHAGEPGQDNRVHGETFGDVAREQNDVSLRRMGRRDDLVMGEQRPLDRAFLLILLDQDARLVARQR